MKHTMIFLLVFSVCQVVVASSEKDNPYLRLEVLDVEKIVFSMTKNDCTNYTILLNGKPNEGDVLVERCLAGDIAPAHSVWLVDTNKSEVIASYPVSLYIANGAVKRAIELETAKVRTDLSKFLSVTLLKTPTDKDEVACVVGGTGFMEVDVYIDHIEEMKRSYKKSVSTLTPPNEREIRKLQPWCDRSMD